jgi:molybdate transport system ATP-binding protein
MLISIKNITVRHQGEFIFRGLHFHVNTGEHWALIGESGSGKSALLLTIAGRLNITDGEISYSWYQDWDDPASVPRSPLSAFIALVEQKHHFRNLSNSANFYYQQRYNSSEADDALTVAQYLAGIKTTRPGYWDMDSVMLRLSLRDLSTKQLIKLSNGETKRLLIAASLIKNPVLLLLDSPLTGLDAETRLAFNNLFTEIAQSGITLIVSTSPTEIPEVTTHVAILKDRKIAHAVVKENFDSAAIPVAGGVKAVDALLDLLAHPVAYNYQWVVKMNHVQVKYGETTILKNISWEIKQGERWALLGPNGSGKSTLLSLINGDNPQAYANDIILFDRKRGSGESIWDIKQKTGFVSPELFQYFPTDNSCLQVIESGFYDTLGLFRPSDPKKAGVALKWMLALEIDRYSRTLFKNIPASAQRLCLLARAMIKNPALLIFDEPCQGMDAQQQQHFKQVVETLCSVSNVTVIYVTHYEQEIPDCVTQILRLDKGELKRAD